MAKLGKKGTSELKTILALAVIILGVFGSVFWGLGIGFSNNFISWVGRIILVSIPLVLTLIERWIK